MRALWDRHGPVPVGVGGYSIRSGIDLGLMQCSRAVGMVSTLGNVTQVGFWRGGRGELVGLLNLIRREEGRHGEKSRESILDKSRRT